MDDVAAAHIDGPMAHTAAIAVQQEVTFLQVVHLVAIPLNDVQKPFRAVMQVPLIGVRFHLDGALGDAAGIFQAGNQQHATVNALALHLGLIDVRGPQPCIRFFHNRIHHISTSFCGI